MNASLSLPKGIYHDRIILRLGRVIESGWRSNLIVDRCRLLLAGFMQGGGSIEGIKQLKIGRGIEAWDAEPPEPPSPTTEQLADPAPLEITILPSQIVYLDTEGVPTEGPTFRIQVSVTLEPGTPPINGGETTYPLREFGLFGSFGGEDYMIDYVRHPVIHKQASDTLVRTIRLIF